MNNALRWAVATAGLLLVLAAPYLWLYGHASLLWIVCPLIVAWAVWLMTEYLKWARTLGKK
jgi:hypothetical protein